MLLTNNSEQHIVKKKGQVDDDHNGVLGVPDRVPC